MEERRDQQPPPVTRPPVIASTASRLSPVQEAWGAYVEHTTHCDNCRSLDGGRCAESDTLYRSYRQADSDAYRQLHHGAP
jgi:hypothetical protein